MLNNYFNAVSKSQNFKYWKSNILKQQDFFLPLNIVVFQTLSQACLDGNVSRTPVWVAPDAVHNWLGGLSLQRKGFIKWTKLEGILGEPVHGVLF